MVEVSLTIGKLDASLLLLLTKDHHLIEFPTILLPDGVIAGSVVKIKCDRDLELEQREIELFNKTQQDILEKFGLNLPQLPILKIRNITQTSCVLEWDKLELATSTIKSLNLYKDGIRLGQIPNPLQNTTTKLSGLPVDTQFKFQLKLSTTAGVFKSDEIVVRTHKMTDLSGITVCIGEIDDPKITRTKIEESLLKMNAKPLQDKVLVDTTHFICTKPMGREWKKLLDSNIPIVRPEWLKLCELERRIIGVRMFYLDADDSVLKQRDYWGDNVVSDSSVSKLTPPIPTTDAAETTEAPAEVVEPTTETAAEPAVEESTTEEPVAEEPAPVAEEPAPVAEEPIVEETAVEPVVEEAAVEEPVSEPVEETVEAVTEEPVATEEPVEAVTEPIAEPVEESAVTEEPVTEEPVVAEPVTEDSITEVPLTEEPIDEAVGEPTEPTEPTFPIEDSTEPIESIDSTEDVPLSTDSNDINKKKKKNKKKKNGKK